MRIYETEARYSENPQKLKDKPGAGPETTEFYVKLWSARLFWKKLQEKMENYICGWL